MIFKKRFLYGNTKGERIRYCIGGIENANTIFAVRDFKKAGAGLR